jgi:hypothetical protein
MRWRNELGSEPKQIRRKKNFAVKGKEYTQRDRKSVDLTHATPSTQI